MRQHVREILELLPFPPDSGNCALVVDQQADKIRAIQKHTIEFRQAVEEIAERICFPGSFLALLLQVETGEIRELRVVSQ